MSELNKELYIENDDGYDFAYELNKALENCIECGDIDKFGELVDEFNLHWNQIIWFTDLDYEVELMDTCLDSELYEFFKILYTKHIDENMRDKYIENFNTNDFGCLGYERGKQFIEYTKRLKNETKTNLL